MDHAPELLSVAYMQWLGVKAPLLVPAYMHIRVINWLKKTQKMSTM